MTAPARDRIVGYKGPARVDDGDHVTYEYERSDGTRLLLGFKEQGHHRPALLSHPCRVSLPSQITIRYKSMACVATNFAACDKEFREFRS